MNQSWHQLEMTVAMTSKQISWLFSNNLMKGNASKGRNSVSPKIEDQCAMADSTLRRRSEREESSATAVPLHDSQEFPTLQWVLILKLGKGKVPAFFDERSVCGMVFR